MSKAVLQITAAPAGSGKTYVRGPVFLCERFLLQPEGVHCSNLPLRFDAIAAYVAKKTGGDAAELLERLVAIPKETLDDWAAERSGPWATFAGQSIEGWHIAIDEAHNFIGEKHSKEHKRRWQQWLGELRHLGATCELISQDESKLAREVLNEAAMKRLLSNNEERRDPFFKIPLGDWLELKAKFLTGAYESSVWEVECRKVWRQWKPEYQHKWALRQEFFDLYDSYNTPHGGGVKAKSPPHKFKQMNAAALLRWFALAHAWNLVSRAMIVAAFVWVCFCGGGAYLMNQIVSQGGKRIAANKSAKVVPPIGAVEGEPTLADPVATAVQLRKELNAAEKAKATLEERLNAYETAVTELQAKLAAGYVITGVGADWCAFETGDVYRVGETIEGGPYVGKKLVAIDWGRRRVEIEGGEIILLGAKPKPRQTAADRFVPAAFRGDDDPARPVVQAAAPPAVAPVAERPRPFPVGMQPKRNPLMPPPAGPVGPGGAPVVRLLSESEAAELAERLRRAQAGEAADRLGQ